MKKITTVRGGRRADLNNAYFRSAWEANYARILNMRVKNNEIASWRYESTVFTFDKIRHGTTRYVPDFEIKNLDDSIEFHEIKGFMDDVSRVRIARMAKFYPDVKLIVIGTKEYRELERQYRELISEWEK